MKHVPFPGIQTVAADSYFDMTAVRNRLRALMMLGLLGVMTLFSQAQEVKVGDEAPGFELKNQKGEVVKLSDYKGKKNVILVFSRAHW